MTQLTLGMDWEEVDLYFILIGVSRLYIVYAPMCILVQEGQDLLL